MYPVSRSGWQAGREELGVADMGVAATSSTGGGDHWRTSADRSDIERGSVVSCLPAWEDAGRQPDPSVIEPDGSRIEPDEVSPTAALNGLREELGDDAAERFQTHYLALLEQRIAEVHRLIEIGKRDDCITLLLTLETSSHMVGADELSLRAAALRLALGHHQADTGVLYADLVRAGSNTRTLLAH